MKKFIQYIKDFHKEYYNTPLYVAFLLFVGALIAINYSFDIEDSFIDSFYGSHFRILLFFGYHAVAYYGVLLIIWVFNKNKINFTWQFWLKSLIGLLILGVDRSIFPQVSQFIRHVVPLETYRFYFKVFFNVYGLVTIFLMLVILKQIFDRKEKYGIYGLRFDKVDFKAYSIMLLIMIPIVYIATYLPDFLDYYPTYKRTGGDRFAKYYEFPEIVSILIYESIYLFDFLNTELFFRGFLVIGLSKILGKNVVLPMAATYAVLHFGKPMGETISSVFGGYILGIIALYSRNIWGGIFIHGGIAFFMELFAFWRR
jgi:hypothetical protein